jgi:UvrD/REP helicase N-terminal domain
MLSKYCRSAARGVDPARILAVTFTKKAADEMRRRIVRLLDLPSPSSLHVMTDWKRASNRSHRTAGLPRAAEHGRDRTSRSMMTAPRRRVAKLYGPCFACRRCLGLGYASHRENPLRRAMRREQMIKMRLGGSNDPLEPFPQKPRGMHWRTYQRLRDQAHAAKAEADHLLAESIPGLGQFLHPMQPRRKRQRGRRDGGPKPPPAAGSPSTPSRPDRPNRP